ncbi:MAG: hypothetical protein QXF45_04205 [Candidatus Caldarchaeum sp.]
MNREEFYEEIRKVLLNLVDESSEEVVVLVEGPRDEQTLRHIGIRGKVLHASRAEHLLEQMPKPSKIILLYDFDEEGLKNLRKMSNLLKLRGYRVDETYYRKLRKLKRLGINTVEGIKTLMPDLG